MGPSIPRHKPEEQYQYSLPEGLRFRVNDTSLSKKVSAKYTLKEGAANDEVTRAFLKRIVCIHIHMYTQDANSRTHTRAHTCKQWSKLYVHVYAYMVKNTDTRTLSRIRTCVHLQLYLWAQQHKLHTNMHVHISM